MPTPDGTGPDPARSRPDRDGRLEPGRPRRPHPPPPLPLRDGRAGSGEPGAGRRGRRGARAHREVPPRPAGRRRPARRGVPSADREDRSRGGRPAKLYRRSDRQIALSLPQRSYDLLSTILAKGVEEAVADGTPMGDVTARASRERRAPARHGGRAGGARGRLTQAARVEPAAARLRAAHRGRPDGARELPVRQVARDHTDLVCGLNLDFVDGVADGLGCTDLAVSLEPSPGRCCVSARRGPPLRETALPESG